MNPYELSARKLAQLLGVPSNRISQIIKGNRAITADTALRLSLCFGNSAEFWLGLQQDYELDCIQEQRSEIEEQVQKVSTDAA